MIPARYTIEVDQNGRLWRTDAPPSDDFGVLIENNGSIAGEIINNSKTVDVGVSVTGQLNEDVRRYLSGKTEESRRYRGRARGASVSRQSGRTTRVRSVKFRGDFYDVY